MPMGKRSINKKNEFQRHPPDFFRTRVLWARSEKKKKVPNFWKSPKKANLGADVGPTSA